MRRVGARKPARIRLAILANPRRFDFFSHRKAVAAMATVSRPPLTPDNRIPPLEAGDRLSRAEFEKRFSAMPELKRAELIEGVVYMPSPVRLRRHGRPHFHLITWLGVYEGATPGVIGADNVSTRLDLDNEPQPDAVLLVDPDRGGRARISTDDYVEAPPELVAEVASSSVSYDLTDKLKVYRRNGVCEYLVWRVLDREIDWFALSEGEYVRLPLDDAGLHRSHVFPGLWLDPTALIDGDMTTVLAALKRGLASPEHAAFVARLNPQPTP
jgi:Uma2 family endonuclease